MVFHLTATSRCSLCSPPSFPVHQPTLSLILFLSSYSLLHSISALFLSYPFLYTPSLPPSLPSPHSGAPFIPCPLPLYTNPPSFFIPQSSPAPLSTIPLYPLSFHSPPSLPHPLPSQVIAATNRVDTLDPALLRSGRLDRKIEFPLPTVEARAHILRIHSRKMNISSDVNFDELARYISHEWRNELGTKGNASVI